MTGVLDVHGTWLREIDGVAAVTRSSSDRPDRYLVAVRSSTCVCHLCRRLADRDRLACVGDRRLNSAIHLIAVTQVRMRHSIGRDYFDKKIAEGKSRNEAMRCLKRRLANYIWRMMIVAERRLTGVEQIAA